MIRRFAYDRVSRSLAFVALAAYSSIGLFGYGLHAVWNCEHCPHGACDSHCQTVGEGHHATAHAGRHDDAPADEAPRLTTADDDCSICSFLAQAQTSAVAGPLVEGVEPLADAAHALELLVLASSSEAQLARGPPLA
jgi:hypothetical protein